MRKKCTSFFRRALDCRWRHAGDSGPLILWSCTRYPANLLKGGGLLVNHALLDDLRSLAGMREATALSVVHMVLAIITMTGRFLGHLYD
jgi:hypothetical protein